MHQLETAHNSNQVIKSVLRRLFEVVNSIFKNISAFDSFIEGQNIRVTAF